MDRDRLLSLDCARSQLSLLVLLWLPLLDKAGTPNALQVHLSHFCCMDANDGEKRNARRMNSSMWMKNNWTLSLYISLVYVILIFWGQVSVERVSWVWDCVSTVKCQACALGSG